MGSIGPVTDPIQQDLEQLIVSSRRYQEQPPGLDSHEARCDLLVKATRLVHTIRGPADMLFGQFENVSAFFAYVQSLSSRIDGLVDDQYRSNPNAA